MRAVRMVVLLSLLVLPAIGQEEPPRPATPEQAAEKAERLHRLLDAVGDNPSAEELVSVAKEIRTLGRGYRGALSRAVLAGGRSFNVQLWLSRILYGEPFHAPEILYAAVDEDDLVVRRIAVLFLLGRDRGDPERKHKPLSDRIFSVIEEWCSDPSDPHLFMVLSHVRYNRDPRLVELLLPILGVRPQDCTEDLSGVGRVNKNRQHCAQVLGDYLPDERVVKTFLEVVRREGEAEMVQFFVWKALASKGYAKDPEIYWVAARSKNDYIRQVLAEHLPRVKDPRVLPILVQLIDDRRDVVRRGAVDSLIALRSPRLLEEIRYLAEDSYSSIKGDLAQAVDAFRRDDLIPFLAWCLLESDPIVVEKAVVALFRRTGEHPGFSKEEWTAYDDKVPFRGGNQGTARMNIIKAFIEDDKRRESAVTAWAKSHPPRYTDEDRVPHLIRQLGHADRRNVKRAMRTLARITGRSEGFPEVLLDPSGPAQEQADALFCFMQEQRAAVIARWKAWSETYAAQDALEFDVKAAATMGEPMEREDDLEVLKEYEEQYFLPELRRLGITLDKVTLDPRSERVNRRGRYVEVTWELGLRGVDAGQVTRLTTSLRKRFELTVPIEISLRRKPPDGKPAGALIALITVGHRAVYRMGDEDDWELRPLAEHAPIRPADRLWRAFSAVVKEVRQEGTPIWLEEFKATQREVRIRGYSRSREVIDTLSDKMRELSSVREVLRERSEPDGRTGWFSLHLSVALRPPGGD